MPVRIEVVPDYPVQCDAPRNFNAGNYRNLLLFDTFVGASPDKVPAHVSLLLYF